MDGLDHLDLFLPSPAHGGGRFVKAPGLICEATGLFVSIWCPQSAFELGSTRGGLGSYQYVITRIQRTPVVFISPKNNQHV